MAEGAGMTGMVTALGTMSGTSLDGVDAATVVTDGERIAGFGPVAYRAYTPAERDILRAALGRWPGEPGVEEVARAVEAAHAELLGPMAGEVAGFHGQTLAHEPKGRGTHQAGSGARLAAAIGRPVVWDFRTADVAAGGEGAPLAPFFHFACAKWMGAQAPLAFLNLGGVGNLTWIDPSAPAPEAPGALLAFDTGPANAPIDDFIRARTSAARDDGGALAASGRVDDAIVAALLDDPYFARVPPKSLDRNGFPGLLPSVAPLSTADGAATLTAAVVATVAAGFTHLPAPVSRLLVTGGGRHNATMMAMMATRLGVPVEPVEAAGLDGDMLEAQAFAYLTVRVLRGLPLSAPATTGVAQPTPGGRISPPGAMAA